MAVAVGVGMEKHNDPAQRPKLAIATVNPVYVDLMMVFPNKGGVLRHPNGQPQHLLALRMNTAVFLHTKLGHL